jgi:hypothetical protein
MAEVVYITRGAEEVGPYSSSKTANVAAVTLTRRTKQATTVNVYTDDSGDLTLTRRYRVELYRGHVKITTA